MDVLMKGINDPLKNRSENYRTDKQTVDVSSKAQYSK